MVPNEILDAAFKSNLSGNAFKVMMCIIRKTYGWQTESDYISAGEVASAIGITRQSANTAINKLASLNMIFVLEAKKGQARRLAVNPASKSWVHQNDAGNCHQNDAGKVVLPIYINKKKYSEYPVVQKINPDVWEGFIEMRKVKRKPLTDRAITLLLNKLTDFDAKGYDVNAIIDAATENCWTSVFIPKSLVPHPAPPKLKEVTEEAIFAEPK